MAMSESKALPDQEQRQLLLVSLGQLRLGLPVEQLLETLRMVAITALPGAPAVVEGVINYRGALVAVLDIRARFGVAPVPQSAAQYLVVAQLPERRVAIRVDAVQDLVAIDAARIERAADIERHSDYIAGIARLDEGLVAIHDLRRFLDDLEASALDQVLQEHPL